MMPLQKRPSRVLRPRALIQDFPRCLFLIIVLAILSPSCMPHAATAFAATDAGTPRIASGASYVLGPEDALLIRIKNEPQISEGPYAISLGGDLTVPEIGTVHAAGMSLAELQEVVTQRSRRYLKVPVVHVSIAEYRSQRVTILGAVVTPGVQQIRGRKTLFEVISDAGGLRQNAGGTIQISRTREQGALPLPGASIDPGGRSETAVIDVDSLMKARNLESNIAVRADDVVTVPRAGLVYVLGAVRKPGGFELSERQGISVMQALSLAEGVERTASTKHARILRRDVTTAARTEIPVDLGALLKGTQVDLTLQPNDILVVPTSTGKSVSFRALEALVSTGSGLAIYRSY